MGLTQRAQQPPGKIRGDACNVYIYIAIYSLNFLCTKCSTAPLDLHIADSSARRSARGFMLQPARKWRFWDELMCQMPGNRPKLVILACPKIAQISDFGI